MIIMWLTKSRIGRRIQPYRMKEKSVGLTAKPGRATGLIALFLCCASSPLAAMGSAFYSREVHTTHHLSAGCSVEDGVYYLSAYRLYRSPRGIARFPDGGRARCVLFWQTRHCSSGI